ncbi:MAG: hypothetical protein HOM44_12025 [Gammaproteobacteria bacterium]|mgnify:CR=1 FL=1|jgi:hypothetical protein|nr:hypothetical protein [Gammaproteobacteria bacterium]MBT7878322.1 hypothetical protein [Gammaproteobacteria bacterium]
MTGDSNEPDIANLPIEDCILRLKEAELYPQDSDGGTVYIDFPVNTPHSVLLVSLILADLEFQLDDELESFLLNNQIVMELLSYVSAEDEHDEIVQTVWENVEVLKDCCFEAKIQPMNTLLRTLSRDLTDRKLILYSIELADSMQLSKNKEMPGTNAQLVFRYLRCLHEGQTDINQHEKDIDTSSYFDSESEANQGEDTVDEWSPNSVPCDSCGKAFTLATLNKNGGICGRCAGKLENTRESPADLSISNATSNEHNENILLKSLLVICFCYFMY